MHRLLPAFAALLSPFAAAQDFLHYKFDSGCTAEVINFARGAEAFAQNGVLESNTGVPFVPGRFGSALAGGNLLTGDYNRVRTGWMPNQQPLSGSLTLAFFAKQRHAPGVNIAYLLGTSLRGHRLFTNGTAGHGLVLRDVITAGGSPTAFDLELPATATDFVARAAADWVHIALVVDANAGTALWYVDGQPVYQFVGIGPAQIDSAGEYLVGFQGAVNECNYDLDEFVLSNRAYPAADVLTLAQAPRAGEGHYDSDVPSQCGADNVVVAATGGAPALGNGAYEITVTTSTSSLFVLLPGLTRCSYGGALPLPFPGAAIAPAFNGCWVLADAVTLVTGVTTSAWVTLPLPLPNAPVYLGATLFFQAVALDLGAFTASMSNGFAVGIGR